VNRFGLPTDAAIEAMLETRADRGRRFRMDVVGIVAAAGPRTRRLSFAYGALPRSSVAAGALAAVFVAATLVAGSLATHPAASSVPNVTTGSDDMSARSASPPAPPGAGPESARLLTPAEFGELARMQRAQGNGTIVAVNGRLLLDPTVQCHRGTVCGDTLLAGSGGGFHVKPVGDIGPGPWDGSGPMSGTFALRLSNLREAGEPVVEFVGRLMTPPTGQPAWFVQDLVKGAAHVEGTFAAVQGWLVRGPFRACASDPHPTVVAYGCPTDDWLTESFFQPLQADGSSIGPPAAISLSSGSYDRWAREPLRTGRDGLGVEPRYATYLLWLVSDGCGPNADCAIPPPRWRIVGRFDPIPVGPTIPEPSPTVVPQGSVPRG